MSKPEMAELPPTEPPPPMTETRGRLLAHVDHLRLVADRASAERLPKIAAGILASAVELESMANRMGGAQ